ncbi:MAG TPA: tRNA (adenosine(37)-N6)-dimethylallyltransferase MiaA [Gemmatimonadaceae bacterium]|nr:tRNA (adenosine(37)-N6)-dimethylallyltransferase MiaA [Gemmatimonadaceae bacterium]
MNWNDGSAGADIRVICGPTAAGKSALALALAARHDASIIVADSRQVYRGFDIGTAKPDVTERALVPHAGIDLCDPTARFSAARWAEVARDGIAAALEAGRVPIVVGGTGFYLRALFSPLFEEPALDPGARAELEVTLAGRTTDDLRRTVAELDPPRAHLGRTQLLRAIEVASLTGRSITDWHKATARAPDLQPRYLVVDPAGALHARIERRLDAMLDGGWPAEVRALSADVPVDAPAWKSCGYAAVREMVAGRIAPAEARATVLVQTRQYAKRQRTWFRHQLPADRAVRLDPDDPSAVDRVDAWWHGAFDA